MSASQDIYHVAQTIADADAVDPTGGRTLEEWREFNRSQGFSFEARLGTEGPGNYTRVEGLQLSDRELERAFQQAALLAEFAAESERERETGQAAAVYVHLLPRD